MERLKEILEKLAHLDLSDDVLDIQPFANVLGGSCEVFVARSKRHEGKKVAVKRIRVFLTTDEALAKVRLNISNLK